MQRHSYTRLGPLPTLETRPRVSPNEKSIVEVDKNVLRKLVAAMKHHMALHSSDNHVDAPTERDITVRDRTVRGGDGEEVDKGSG